MNDVLSVKHHSTVEPLELCKKSGKTYIKVKCLQCGKVWLMTFDHYKRQEKCLFCSKQIHNTKDLENNKMKNPYLKILGEFVNYDTKIKCQCIKCGYIWETFPGIIKKGCGCPRCNFSTGEIQISEFLHKHNIEFISQYVFPECKFKNALRFDFYLPKFNTCIEFQGKQHYEPVKYWNNIDCEAQLKLNQARDNAKKNFCLKNNIDLLCISYKDQKNIPEILTKCFIDNRNDCGI